MIVGGFIGSKFHSTPWLKAWIIANTIITLFPVFMKDSPATYVILFSIIAGASIGMGLPKCLAYVGESSNIKERGRINSVILMVTFLLFPILVPLISSLGLVISSIIFAIWRLSGLISLVRQPVDKVTQKKTSPNRLLLSGVFLTYLLSWFFFYIIEKIEVQFLRNFYAVSILNNYTLIAYVVGGVAMLLSGILLDYFGRKVTIILSMATLGIGYALVGFLPQSLFSVLLFSIIDGFTWGNLTVVFVLTIWCELWPSYGAEKFYAIGDIPLFLSPAISLIIGPLLTGFSLMASFSIAALLIFAAVFFLFFTKETLPQDTVETRKMKRYISDAKKKINKERA